MEEEEIISQTLYKLDGWVLDGEDTDELSSAEYNKKIKSDEILHFFKVATDYALAFTRRDELESIPVKDTALILWTAGLIWRKYNIRTNNQLDETTPLGYGDSLIIQAKEMFKPYKAYAFTYY